MNFTIAPWYPKTTPTSTVSLISVEPTYSGELMALITSAASQALTETKRGELYKLSRAVRGALASLTIINAQEFLHTAQDPFLKPYAETAIYNSTLNIQNLKNSSNIFRYDMNLPGNVIFVVVFALLMLYNLVLALISHHTYFTVCFICGSFLETLGYIGRCVGYHRDWDVNMYLMQTVCLVVAPTFFAAGIYYLLGQFIVVHSVEYGLLSPFTYSYVFVACDIISLVLQATGGAMAGSAGQKFENTLPGTHIMLAGIAFQVASITLFLFFWCHFLGTIYLAHNTVRFKWHDLPGFLMHDYDFTFFKEQFEKKFDPHFAAIRTRFFYWFPIPVTAALLFIYARCIYRLVELSQGWRGNLMTHEAYLLVFDGALVSVCGLILVPFHPYFIFGNENLSLLRWERSRSKTPNQDEKSANLDTKSLSQATAAFNSVTPEVEQPASVDAHSVTHKLASEDFYFFNLHAK